MFYIFFAAVDIDLTVLYKISEKYQINSNLWRIVK